MATKRKTITLRLVRCGDTPWSEQNRLFGSTDLPLSDAGRAELAEAIKRLTEGKAASVYHPADEAAEQTANAFAKALRGKTRVVPDLADPALGVLEGMTQQEFSDRFAKRHKQWHDDPLSLTPPEGEDFVLARSRILTALARILRRSRSNEVVVVLHSLGIGFVKCWLLDRPCNDIWRLLEARPRVERFAIDTDMIDAMETAASLEPTGG